MRKQQGRFRVGRWSIVLALAALAFLAAWWSQRPASAYETVAVSRGNIESVVTALGTLQPLHYVDVGAQVSGQIKRIHIGAGEIVQQGQLLVEIDASVQQAIVDAGRASLDALRAQHEEARAAFELAQSQYGRQQQMMRDGATRREDMDLARAAFKSSQASVKRIAAEIRRTQATLAGDEAQLGYSRIYAPMAGTVVSLEARPGQTLNATYQTPNILRIADLSAMTVWTEVSEADVARVKPGMPVYFTTLGQDGRRWSSKLRQILPMPPRPAGGQAADAGVQPAAKVVLYTALFDVDNADGTLMAQMTAQVFFVAASAQNVLTVPLPALAALPDAPHWYTARVLDDAGVIQQRRVRAGTRDRLAIEVVEGLEEGERVVTGERSGDGGVRRFTL